MASSRSSIPSSSSKSSSVAGCHTEAGVTGPTDNLKEIKKLFRTDKSWQAWLVKPHMGIDSSTDNKLVFVVEFPNGKPNLEQGERDALPGTELEFRCPNDRSNELAVCIDKTIKSTLNDTDTELKIISAIKENREQLHKNHSKLSEIRLSKVKSSGFGTKNAKIKDMYCIALVVPYKGLIPVDEDKFPPTINDFPTDVWEGQISPLYHPASHQALSQLLMGASIEIRTDAENNYCTYCTIGPLIQHKAKGETKKTYILSVAHGTVKECEIETIIEPVENLTDTQSNNMLCYQPNSSVDESPFGKVVKRVLAWNKWDRWIDAALIEITNQDKIPTGGYFPDSEDSFEMFNGRAMAFNSGRLIKREEAPEFTDANDKKKFVYKYGATTGLTKGFILRKRDDDRYFEVMNDRHDFCKPGDSGSLVLLFEQNARCRVHSDHQKHEKCSCLVRALGIIVGTNHVTTQCLYISDCLKNLGIHDVEECLSFSQHDSVPPLRST